MSLNLTIDQGNTAAKLALWDGDRLMDLLISPTLTPDEIERFVGSGRKVDAAIYCSVASRGQEVMEWMRAHIRRVMRLTDRTPLPIVIDYATPHTLGADRVAASVGAWTIMPGRPLLVVDAGTAVTYDAVSADGHFLGGNIAPGMSMRLEALHRFTARLPRVKVPWHIDYGNRFMGDDTSSAMILGAVYGIVGAVAYYRSHLPEDTQVVMTGGWASEIGRLCDFDVTVDADLVTRGLNRILLYNENK